MSSTPVQPDSTSSAESDSTARRHSGVHETFLDVLGVALPGGDARGFLRRVVQYPAHLLRIEIGRAGRRRGRTENSHDAVRASVFLGLHTDAPPMVSTTRVPTS